MTAGLIGAIMQFVDTSSALHWRMKDGSLSTQWYPLGEELYAGGLGCLTVRVAAQTLTCYSCHTIAPGLLYICCTQDKRQRHGAIYCLEHAPRQIEVRSALTTSPVQTPLRSGVE